MCSESKAIEDQRVKSFFCFLHDLCFYLSADYILLSFISCTAASLEHLAGVYVNLYFFFYTRVFCLDFSAIAPVIMIC